MPKLKKSSHTLRHDPIQKQSIVFNKGLGQHILKNPLVIDSMIEKVRDDVL